MFKNTNITQSLNIYVRHRFRYQPLEFMYNIQMDASTVPIYFLC